MLFLCFLVDLFCFFFVWFWVFGEIYLEYGGWYFCFFMIVMIELIILEMIYNVNKVGNKLIRMVIILFVFFLLFLFIEMFRESCVNFWGFV